MKTTKIFLNEGTEIEVKESKQTVRDMIKQRVGAEKMPYKGEDLHFLELTRIVEEKKMVEKGGFWGGWEIEKTKKEIKIDLYFKRILFFYES